MDKPKLIKARHRSVRPDWAISEQLFGPIWVIVGVKIALVLAKFGQDKIVRGAFGPSVTNHSETLRQSSANIGRLFALGHTDKDVWKPFM